MTSRAYAVGVLHVEKGKRPRYAGVGIFSEAHPTVSGVSFVVAEIEGLDYPDARRRLLCALGLPSVPVGALRAGAGQG